MNQRNNTLKITWGAMIIAIFAVFLLINRQTAGMLEETIMFLFPIPMVAYSVRFGFKTSLPVFAGMVLISLLFGTLTTIFYAVSEAFIGLAFGSCLNRHVDMTKTLVLVMVLSIIANLLSLFVTAGISGYDINTDIQLMQESMTEAMQKTGLVLPEQMLTTDYLRRIFLVSMMLTGAVQGFIVFEVSLLVLRRLRMPVQKPRSIYLYFPPKWTGIAAFLLFMVYGYTYGKPFEDELWQNIAQTAGILGFVYLLIFGAIGFLLFSKVYFHATKALQAVFLILSLFMLSQFTVFFGLFYISTGLHQRLLDVKEEQAEGKNDASAAYADHHSTAKNSGHKMSLSERANLVSTMEEEENRRNPEEEA